ncbi:hypothetical protein [Halarcobacter bivalviorum]|uniref:hypothetical protein n=1 Tax=Halarcobacter bivalviorum TaxID=663364 RepID=UPI00100BB018|nr:hypothetical protein [Halarcobacter bivalviorum]RXK04481.1 hypothetical protein CRU97_10870 [Halarcobacter bivalviorum]
MKLFFITIFLPLILSANKYTYLLDEYQKETELEAKIVTKIAKDILVDKPIYLYIPHMQELDKKIYSLSVKIVQNCNKANFIFVKYSKPYPCEKKQNPHYLLTNNYKQLLSNSNFLGAFFWSKSRPNIVLIRERLKQKKVKLSEEYERYIEDIE